MAGLPKLPGFNFKDPTVSATFYIYLVVMRNHFVVHKI